MSSVLNIQPIDLVQIRSQEYDGFLCALGFEARARAIAEKLEVRAKRRVAVGFTENRVLEYETNRDWFSNAQFTLREPPDTEAESTFKNELSEMKTESSGDTLICVDISSLSRLRIAHLVTALTELSNKSKYTVDFVYSGADFSVPGANVGLNVSSGPVTDQFAGWSDDPDKPPAVILGLGYEHDKAIGAVEYIEPAEIWVFVPTDHEREYDDAIKEANRPLLASLNPNRLWRYSVYQPYDCFKKLESLTYGVLRNRRPVMVPFGPKLFMLCCLFVAAIHAQVAVWRFSSGDFEIPVNRISNGRFTCIRAVFFSGA